MSGDISVPDCTASRYWAAPSSTALNVYEGYLNSGDRKRTVSRHVTETEERVCWLAYVDCSRSVGRAVPSAVIARADV